MVTDGASIWSSLSDESTRRGGGRVGGGGGGALLADELPPDNGEKLPGALGCGRDMVVGLLERYATSWFGLRVFASSSYRMVWPWLSGKVSRWRLGTRDEDPSYVGGT